MIPIFRPCAAAEVTDATAIHPGYGAAAVNIDFAERVENSGFASWPDRQRLIRLMGDEFPPNATWKLAGVPTVPGSDDPLPEDEEIARWAVSGIPGDHRPLAAAIAACAWCITRTD
jgi:biotin carboxylase